MSTWIPNHIKAMDEFLDEELHALAEYVWKERQVDIREELYVYENRVLLHNYAEIEKKIGDKDYYEIVTKQGLNINPLNWSSILVFEDENKDPCREYEIELRAGKKLFLKGWLEVDLWDMGNCETQFYYSKPQNASDIGLTSDSQGYFILSQEYIFSISVMDVFLNKYISTNKGGNIFTNKLKEHLLEDNDDKWHLLVNHDIIQYYFDHNEKVSEMGEYKIPEKLDNDWGVISFRKDNQALHAAIANCISWQNFLSKLKGDNMGKKDKILDRVNSRYTGIYIDKTEISHEVDKIIKKLSSTHRINELDKNEYVMISNLIQKSPKIKLLVRRAQMNYVRTKISEEFSKSSEKRSMDFISVNNIFEGISKVLCDNLSIFTPAMAHKAEIKQEKYKVKSLIEFTCSIKDNSYYLVDKDSSTDQDFIDLMKSVRELQVQHDTFLSCRIIAKEKDRNWSTISPVKKFSTDDLPIIIDNAYPQYECFIVIIDRDKNYVNECVDYILSAMNNNEAAVEKVYSSTVILLINLP